VEKTGENMNNNEENKEEMKSSKAMDSIENDAILVKESNSEKNSTNTNSNQNLKKSRSMINFIDKILPSFEPLLELEEKLIENELEVDHTVIRHFEEIQILIGLVLMILSFPLVSFFGFASIYLVGLLGFILVFTGFEIEEIYITTRRVIIRRIGLLERILRIPSDEEHSTEHIVSYTIGRAPFNIILLFFGLLGIITLYSTNLHIIGDLVIFFTSLYILKYALRLGKRSLTIYLAGGHHTILGQRKGIPSHIVISMMKIIFKAEKNQT